MTTVNCAALWQFKSLKDTLYCINTATSCIGNMLQRYFSIEQSYIKWHSRNKTQPC